MSDENKKELKIINRDLKEKESISDEMFAIITAMGKHNVSRALIDFNETGYDLISICFNGVEDVRDAKDIIQSSQPVLLPTYLMIFKKRFGFNA